MLLWAKCLMEGDYWNFQGFFIIIGIFGYMLRNVTPLISSKLIFCKNNVIHLCSFLKQLFTFTFFHGMKICALHIHFYKLCLFSCSCLFLWKIGLCLDLSCNKHYSFSIHNLVFTCLWHSYEYESIIGSFFKQNEVVSLLKFIEKTFISIWFDF